MKPKRNQAANEYIPQKVDLCQTPPYAFSAIAPFIGQNEQIWEPAVGEGHLAASMKAAGYSKVYGTDLQTGHNFFDYEPSYPQYVIVTNPPYTLKFRWLTRCVQLGVPFALLVPVEMIGAVTAQTALKNVWHEFGFLDTRVDFKMPGKTWAESSSQFPVMWLCHNILPKPVNYLSIAEAKKAFKDNLKEKSS